ncbi:prepilin-type N-terminal cleavage/methylation domain-containing protein [Colwellia sp. 1_MG-2023]|uniref:prepilin-type N-terminal cleavage/methylation domain-containing protein n=1 Tax=Colwellia sp. 1_MG-2023 TaxID=3062649 RepID=UPI0026E11458|nr:prepilin-type N-terminal cleavage/methylation domain-containing protein [Colwellia sp. 1_MG-2023]MDO6444335.1 prepilin-type N-terminal cleavage/methylation domain-containing protein [Colwellia sp. 1_MG-2023]
MVTVLTSLKKNKGFTLIELMLATSLLMMVLFSGYYAYSLYSQKWQKRVDIFWQGTEQGIGIDALNKLFISAVSYVVKNNNNKESIYFVGTKSTIRFISNSPLFSSGTALVELEVIREAEKDRLIYRENNLLNQPLFHLSELENIIDWQKETVLFEEYNAIEWSFYGWTSFADALEQANIAENVVKRELRKQYKLHELEKIRVLPISIHLNLAKENSQSSFNIDLPNNTIYTLIANFRNDA